MIRRKKIAIIISGVDYRYVAFEWLVNFINHNKFHLYFITIDCESETFNSFLRSHQIKNYRLDYLGESRIKLLQTVYKVYKVLRKEKTDIVHTHVFDANLIGLTAAWFARIPKRIYTRHYSTATYILEGKRVKWDKYINRIATNIVAVSEIVKEVLVLREGVPGNKITMIHHGFDLSEFENLDENRITKLKSKYNPNNNFPVIGVVSTFQELKGIRYIISAFQEILTDFPNALLVLANAKGKDQNEFYSLLESGIPKSSYITIPFERDLFSLFKLFNVFIHVPIDKNVEAFGQVYIEAMASGIPMVITKSGIANEIFTHKINAYIVDYKNSNQIAKGVNEILMNDELTKVFDKDNRLTVELFGIDKMMRKLEYLYDK